MTSYDGTMSLRDYRIAMCDEIEIEEIVLSYGPHLRPEQTSARDEELAALREIDRLKVNGTYEEERARLAAIVAAVDPLQPLSADLDATLRMNATALQNLLDGLVSPAPDQRARFSRLYHEAGFEKRALLDGMHILECLEPAQKPKGRPAAKPPWRNVVHQLDAMRLSVAAGSSVPSAAREQAEREGSSQRDSRAKYFERLFRARVALRK